MKDMVVHIGGGQIYAVYQELKWAWLLYSNQWIGGMRLSAVGRTSCISTVISRLRKRLEPQGWTVESRRVDKDSRHWYEYRLARVTE